MAEQFRSPAIEARGLRKAFENTTAVDVLDLNVAAGEVFGLLGPDGAGKSTVLGMLCGELRPSGGWASVAGCEVVSQAEQVRRRVGHVPQRLALYPELAVDENLLFQARSHGVAGKLFEERREWLLSFSRLGRVRNRPAQELSVGMRQKLALSCALIHRPQVLLLDEPTAGADPVSRGEFWELLLRLAEEGVAVLVATSYVDEAERCHRVGLLYEGRLLATGTPLYVRRKAQVEVLEVTCRLPGKGRTALRRVPGVRWAEVFGEGLHVAVERLDQEEGVRRALAAAGVPTVEVRQIEPGLADAFFELAKRRREELT